MDVFGRANTSRSHELLLHWISFVFVSQRTMRLLLLLSVCAFGFGSKDGERLYKDLLDHEFLKLEFPKQESEPVVVKLGITAKKINIDKETTEMWLHSWLSFEWRDYRMAWEPSDYGNRTLVRLPQEKIWMPDIVLFNGLNPEEKMFETGVAVYNSGTITHMAPHIFNVDCYEIESDELSCYLKFGSWSYDGFDIELIAGDIDLTTYTINDEWNLMSIGTIYRVFKKLPDYKWLCLYWTQQSGAG